MPKSSQHREASSRLKSSVKESHYVKNIKVFYASMMYHCKGNEVCLFWTETLGWLAVLQGHWDVNRKGKVVGFYVDWIFFVPWSLIPWTCKYFSNVSGAILSCGRPCLMCWVLGQLRDCSPGLQVGQCHFILSVGHMGSLTLKLLEYGYALTHDKNVISIQSCSQASFGEKRWWWSLSRLSKSVRANKYERYSR